MSHHILVHILKCIRRNGYFVLPNRLTVIIS
jgi:hypothetical protein